MSQRTKLWFAVVILIVAAGWATYQLTRPGPVSSSVRLVCVATGETFRMDRDELIMVPMKNPDTGERTLLPCHKQENGWFVNSRYRAALDQLGEKNRYVDPETLAVRTSP